jgi:uncharacterized protein YdeI (YjbR/CyaY-like superfamily)
MAPPGLAAIDAAKAANQWVGLPDVDRLHIPADLAAAFDNAAHHDWFTIQAPSYRRNVLRWLAIAKRPETRQGRIAAIVSAAREQVRLRHF